MRVLYRKCSIRNQSRIAGDYGIDFVIKGETEIGPLPRLFLEFVKNNISTSGGGRIGFSRGLVCTL